MIQIILTPIETGSAPVALEWNVDDVQRALSLTETKLWSDFSMSSAKERLMIHRLATRVANERARRMNPITEVVDSPDVAMIGLGIIHYKN